MINHELTNVILDSSLTWEGFKQATQIKSYFTTVVNANMRTLDTETFKSLIATLPRSNNSEITKLLISIRTIVNMNKKLTGDKQSVFKSMLNLVLGRISDKTTYSQVREALMLIKINMINSAA